MLRIETVLLILALAVAFIRPTVGSSFFETIEEVFSRLAERRGLAVVAVGIIALALRAAVLPIEPIPEPIVHDEFGYLLAADTFALGRLTNPTPPMWQHFETFSILMKPTYQCFAPPAQGIFLAFGEILFGHPFWGVWLSAGLMCAAITWMLQGWFGPGWALLGGVLAILQYGVFSYWANSYWGGAVATIGGALVVGALPRIRNIHRIRDTLLLGLGLALLANSRPFEGLVFALPVAIVLLAWMLRKISPFKVTLRRVVLPLIISLGFTAAGMGYYFWRVTGSPYRMPYEIEQKTYAVAPYMTWKAVKQLPVYNNVVIERMYVEEALAGYRMSRSWVGLLLKLYVAWGFFLGPTLTVPFVMLIFALPRNLSIQNIAPSTLTLLSIFFVSMLGSAVESFYNPHYSAPTTAVVIALVVISFQCLRQWGKSGLFLTRAIPLTCVLLFALRVLAAPLHIPLGRSITFPWYQAGPKTFGRADVLHTLQALPGNHLVLVRYASEHQPFKEWVYNAPDIDHAKVVWSRELSPNQNQALLRYFEGRHVWLLEADSQPPKLSPYKEALAEDTREGARILTHETR